MKTEQSVISERAAACLGGRYATAKKMLLAVWMGMLLLCGYSAVSLAADSVIATVLTGEIPPVIYEGVQGPAIVAVNPVTNKIYAGHGIHNGIVTVIDGITHATTEITVGSGASSMAVNPVTNKIYAANWFDPTVTVIDGDTNATTTIANTAIAYAQHSIVVDSNINKIYVLDKAGVTVIDGFTDTVIRKILIAGSYLGEIAVNPKTHKIYVANFCCGASGSDITVTVIDGTTYTATATIPIGIAPYYYDSSRGDIAINSDTDRIYVSSDKNNTVTVIDAVTDDVITEIAVPVGYGLNTIAVNPASNKLYVVDWSSISIIDGVTNSIIASLATTNHQQSDIEVNTANNKIYVGKYGYSGSPHYVISIDGNTNAKSNIVTGYGGLDIAVNPITHRVYATNSYNNTVSVIGDPSADTTPPIITFSQSPLANANGWNNTDVTVTFTATDAYSLPTCTVNTVTLTTEGAGQVVSTTCTDAAGNSATSSHTVHIDKTAPEVAGTRNPAANASGWNNTDVTVHFIATDSLSGIQGDAAADVLIANEGMAQTASSSFSDLAGNTSSATVSNISIDKTAPSMTMPSLAGNYLVGSSVTLAFAATDTLSGLASNSASLNGNPVSNSSTVVLSRLGSNTFSLTATDAAGNSVTQTTHFTVGYAFGGFLSPLTLDGRTTFHLGSVIPVKFELFDANSEAVTSAVARITLQQVSGDDPVGTPIEGVSVSSADSGNLFRVNGDTYSYNLSTRPLSAGSYLIQAVLDDGTTRSILIGLTSK